LARSAQGAVPPAYRAVAIVDLRRREAEKEAEIRRQVKEILDEG
jgi:hypothetical protein